MEKTKKEALKQILDKLDEFDLNPEEVQKIEFKEGQLVIWGEG